MMRAYREAGMREEAVFSLGRHRHLRGLGQFPEPFLEMIAAPVSLAGENRALMAGLLADAIRRATPSAFERLRGGFDVA